LKVIIAGSRDGFVAKNVFEAVEESPFYGKITEVVSGGARGVDRDGESFAKLNHLPIKLFQPDWDKYKNSAGMLRNIEMAEYADALVAIWDGKSPGTKQMITIMKSKNKPVYIHQR